MIFDIQHCSIHDGDGLRTLVFFKGCPLRCPWCANPESQSFEREILEAEKRCIGCGKCVQLCPKGAIKTDRRIDRNICDKCFKCTEICFANSKQITGQSYSAARICAEVYKDREFYKHFGGGVTFSGGEPLMQPELLYETASLCKKKNLNVMIESCGYGDFDKFKKVLPYIDGMFADIKIFDNEKHKKITGIENTLILDNIRKISEYGIPITIRTPIIPKYTNDAENISAIAEFITSLPTVSSYELLRYHDLGSPKYRALGREYLLANTIPPTDDEMRNLVRFANTKLLKHEKECFWIKDNNKEVIL